MAEVFDDRFYQQRLELWEQRLLDLSMRNKLLNLKTEQRGGALAVSEPPLRISGTSSSPVSAR